MTKMFRDLKIHVFGRKSKNRFGKQLNFKNCTISNKTWPQVYHHFRLKFFEFSKFTFSGKNEIIFILETYVQF